MSKSTPTNLGIFIDQDGGVWPITHYFDEDGNECGPEDAVSAVAGAGDTWYGLRLDLLESPTIQ
jgi:hypothetical protein